MIGYNDLTKNIKDGLKFPTGATSERGNPSKGSLRFNSETGKPEIYAKSRGWKSVAQESSGSSAAYITTGLVVDLDAGNSSSYSGGTTWTDLKGNTNYTWQNKTGSPTHDSSGWIDSGGNGAWLGDSPFPYLSGIDYTLDIWFKYNSYPHSNWLGNGGLGYVFGLTSDEPETDSFQLEIEDYSRYNFYFGDNEIKLIGLGPGISYGNSRIGQMYGFGSVFDWYNVVIVSKTDVDNNLLFYVNGVERTPSSYGSEGGLQKNVTRFVTLGGLTSSDGNLTERDASIASFRVYDKQLSATEVADNFNNTKSRFGL